jgi:Cytidylate kinase-like family
MTVWTIAAQEAREAPASLPSSPSPRMSRCSTEQRLLRSPTNWDPDCPEDDELDRRLGGRLHTLALSTAITAGSPEAFRDVELRHKLPALGRAVVAEAARTPCVIYAPAAFAALAEHGSAVHVRLWAPLEWRISAYKRDQLVDRRCAEKALKRDDHGKRAWVKSLYRVDIDDLRVFSLVIDASRSPGRLVEAMLAVGGVEAARLATELAG